MPTLCEILTCGAPLVARFLFNLADGTRLTTCRRCAKRINRGRHKRS